MESVGKIPEKGPWEVLRELRAARIYQLRQVYFSISLTMSAIMVCTGEYQPYIQTASSLGRSKRSGRSPEKLSMFSLGILKLLDWNQDLNQFLLLLTNGEPDWLWTHQRNYIVLIHKMLQCELNLPPICFPYVDFALRQLLAIPKVKAHLSQ